MPKLALKSRYLIFQLELFAPSGAPLHTLSKLYDVSVGFVNPPPPYFEAEYCLFCGRRRVAVARYRMICLVLVNSHLFPLTEKQNRERSEEYSTVQIQLVPINIFKQVIFLFIYVRCTTRRQLSCRIFLLILIIFFSIRDSLRVQCLFLQIKRELGIYLLCTRISHKNRVNSLTANVRFIRNIGTRF